MVVGLKIAILVKEVVHPFRIPEKKFHSERSFGFRFFVKIRILTVDAAQFLYFLLSGRATMRLCTRLARA